VLAPRGRRSHLGLQIATLSLIAVLVTAGVFLYLMSGLTDGLGSGMHTLSTPPTLGGASQNLNPQLVSAGQAFQAEMESESAATTGDFRQTVLAFYGTAEVTGTGIIPDYFLFLMSASAPLTTADLTKVETILTVNTVQTDNGVEFHCGAPVSGMMTSLCTWIDGNVWGVVEGASAVTLSQTLATAESARDTAEH
jgi:hypothetical protein